ncbi:ABC transporter ATP-binding protein [Streptomyces sp. UNOB3_S3]|uniref:ABC transporter ATP-binding protein n=1 Tax=Streptomyces sp. UNOB3_S3 TaxID=2871682 RepID=UPI001E40DAE1|nr:ABC transporter ATP-binding protein [Streptomyces sp. UNOB3_S3]MCC3773812.1 ABC transporter ATP-binding protein/permease [Streptomyces sp. UNOB3_S3]
MPEPGLISYKGTGARNALEEGGFLRLCARIPRLFGQVAHMAWKLDRTAAIVLLLAEVAAGASAAVVLAVTAKAMVPLVGTGSVGERVHQALPWFIVGGIAAALSRGAHAFGQWAEQRLRPKLYLSADNALVNAVLTVKLATFHNPQFKQDHDRAQAGAVRYDRMVTDTQTFLGSLVRLVAAGGVLAGLHPLMLAVLMLAVLPSGVGTVLRAKIEYRTHVVNAAGRTVMSMMRGYATNIHFGDEIRGNAMIAYLRFWYERMGQVVTARILSEVPRQLRVSLLSYAASGLCLVGAYGVLLLLTVSGRVSLAVSATVIVAVRAALANMRDLLQATVGMFQNSLYLGDWARFIADAKRLAPHEGGAPVPPVVESVRVEKVTFSYPNKTSPAVDDLTLTLRRGEVVALVGENGSGKSTLVRLLLGLTEADKGRITWDGTDLAAADVTEVAERTAVVPQSFACWPLSVRENVTLGQPRTFDDEAVWETLEQVGMVDVVQELPQQLDTLLARELFGGVTLSGGQWQRLACARALYRQPAVLVLDEPTSEMDARGEHAIFTELKKIAADRITVVVTHRLDNTRIADRIVVMEHGRVTEQGTFDQLVTGGGLFQELYELSKDR